MATGCATFGRLAYDNLTTLATWRADSYLSMTSEQRALAAQRIETLHAWHRRTQLDDYIVFLEQIRARVAAGDVDEAQIRRWRLEAFQRWRPIAEQAAPAVAEVSGTLGPAQLARLREEMRRDNDKIRRDWMPPGAADRIQARTRRYVDRAEFLLGSLTAEQKQVARRFAAEAGNAEDAWYAQRVGRQQDLLALMERIRTERPEPPVATVWMREHLHRYAPAPEGGDRFVASSLAAGDAFTAQVFAMATPAQRQHLLAKLQDWIDLLQSLKPSGTASRGGVIALPVGSN